MKCVCFIINIQLYFIYNYTSTGSGISRLAVPHIGAFCMQMCDITILICDRASERSFTYAYDLDSIGEVVCHHGKAVRCVIVNILDGE